MRDPESELADLEAKHLRRRLKRLESPQGARVELAGRELLNFSSNDYLGLANHAALKQAFIDGIARYGTGAGASRLVSGSQAPHHALEEALAAANHTAAAVMFSSGYAAAVGTLPALVGKGDVILLDKLCHASLIDGARLSGAKLRVFPHQNLEKLERLLASERRSLPTSSRVLIVTESVFSMDGDLAALREIVALKEKYGALLLLDEAHGFGVLGSSGMGLAEALGIQSGVDIHMGTLSKSAGLAGGYAAASRPFIDLLINRARSFVFSTATPPALAHAGLTALELCRGPEGAARRGKLASHRHALATALALPAPPAGIFPLILGSAAAALDASAALHAHGFLVPAIRYPTVPLGAARLRVTLSAAHEVKDIAALAVALRGVL
jgi:8-amino-7-oxononanoate synthase